MAFTAGRYETHANSVEASGLKYINQVKKTKIKTLKIKIKL